MKRLTTNLMIAAAAIAAVAGSASAQTLKADIPFTFHAGGTVLPAGTYQIKVNSPNGAPIFVLRNADTGKASMVGERASGDAPEGVEGEWRGETRIRVRRQPLHPPRRLAGRRRSPTITSAARSSDRTRKCTPRKSA